MKKTSSRTSDLRPDGDKAKRVYRYVYIGDPDISTVRYLFRLIILWFTSGSGSWYNMPGQISK